jgi:hypothetical protein
MYEIRNRFQSRRMDELQTLVPGDNPDLQTFYSQYPRSQKMDEKQFPILRSWEIQGGSMDHVLPGGSGEPSFTTVMHTGIHAFGYAPPVLCRCTRPLFSTGYCCCEWTELCHFSRECAARVVQRLLKELGLTKILCTMNLLFGRAVMIDTPRKHVRVAERRLKMKIG